MAITYDSIMTEIKNLKTQAEKLRVEPPAVVHAVPTVIHEIREKIQVYGLTASDVGFSHFTVENIIRTRRKPDVKFRDPITGAVWTGRGKLPMWIKSSGKNKEDFLIGNLISGTRKKPEVKFRDPVSGSTWTGRGKTPTWIKNSGKAKEEFLIN